MKSHYSRFLAAAPGRLHFAAHSHHPWPDVTRDAQLEAWDDAARLADLKWDRVFGEVAKEAQRHIARVLDLPAASQIAFAPNTHEFVVRLLSCFPSGRKLKVVTTDSEFLSFSRQIARLEEEQLVDLVRVARGALPVLRLPLHRSRARARQRSRLHEPGLLQLRLRGQGLRGHRERGGASSDGRDRRLPRLLRDPDQPAEGGRPRVLPGRRLQVRAERRGRLLPERSPRLRGPASQHRLVRGLSDRSRAATSIASPSRTTAFASWAPPSTPWACTASTRWRGSSNRRASPSPRSTIT